MSEAKVLTPLQIELMRAGLAGKGAISIPPEQMNSPEASMMRSMISTIDAREAELAQLRADLARANAPRAAVGKTRGGSLQDGGSDPENRDPRRRVHALSLSRILGSARIIYKVALAPPPSLGQTFADSRALWLTGRLSRACPAPARRQGPQSRAGVQLRSVS